MDESAQHTTPVYGWVCLTHYSCVWMGQVDALLPSMAAYLENVALLELRVAGFLSEFGLQIASLVWHQVYPAIKETARHGSTHQL